MLRKEMELLLVHVIAKAEEKQARINENAVRGLNFSITYFRVVTIFFVCYVAPF